MSSKPALRGLRNLVSGPLTQSLLTKNDSPQIRLSPKVPSRPPVLLSEARDSTLSFCCWWYEELVDGLGCWDLTLVRDKPLECRRLLFVLLEPLKDSVDCVTEDARRGEWGVQQERLVSFLNSREIQPEMPLLSQHSCH